MSNLLFIKSALQHFFAFLLRLLHCTLYIYFKYQSIIFVLWRKYYDLEGKKKKPRRIIFFREYEQVVFPVHLFVFGKFFLLVRVAVDPESVLGSENTRLNFKFFIVTTGQGLQLGAFQKYLTSRAVYLYSSHIKANDILNVMYKSQIVFAIQWIPVTLGILQRIIFSAIFPFVWVIVYKVGVLNYIQSFFASSLKGCR